MVRSIPTPDSRFSTDNLVTLKYKLHTWTPSRCIVIGLRRKKNPELTDFILWIFKQNRNKHILVDQIYRKSLIEIRDLPTIKQRKHNQKSARKDHTIHCRFWCHIGQCRFKLFELSSLIKNELNYVVNKASQVDRFLRKAKIWAVNKAHETMVSLCRTNKLSSSVMVGRLIVCRCVIPHRLLTRITGKVHNTPTHFLCDVMMKWHTPSAHH